MSRAAAATSIIAHPAFVTALNAVQARVAGAPPGSVIRVCGLTGAGKTEILYALARKISGDPTRWASGTLPVAVVRATKADRGRFSTKHFATRMLAAVQEPDLRWTRSADAAGIESVAEQRAAKVQQSSFWASVRERKNETDLRMGCERCWVERGVEVVLVDDTNAMTAVRGSENPSDYLQPWVVATETTGKKLVLFGTSSMHALWDGEGELQRRAKTIYLQRYRLESVEDRKLFVAMLLKMTSTPAWSEVNIAKIAEELYFYTLGVFGQVKKRLDDALDTAIADGREKVTRNDVRSVFPNAVELRRLVERVAEYDALAAPASLSLAKNIYAKTMLRAQARSAEEPSP